MADRPPNLRSIVRIKQTMYVSIPAELVRELGLCPRQVVTVERIADAQTNFADAPVPALRLLVIPQGLPAAPQTRHRHQATHE